MIWIYTFHTDSLFMFSDANIAQMVDMKIIRKDKDPRFGKAPCICLLKECVCAKESFSIVEKQRSSWRKIIL